MHRRRLRQRDTRNRAIPPLVIAEKGRLLRVAVRARCQRQDAVRNTLQYSKINAHELPHHPGVVECLFNRRVRQVEPRLQKILPPVEAPSRAWDSAAPAARTVPATAPPRSISPEISLAASSSCTAQSRSSSRGSSVSFLRHSNLTGCGKQRAESESPERPVSQIEMAPMGFSGNTSGRNWLLAKSSTRR
jgi:hypothetical protein